jgi:hypothetical protein
MHSPKALVTKETMKEYLNELFFTYTEGVQTNSGLEGDYPVLGVFEDVKGQVTDDIMELLGDTTSTLHGSL